MDTLSLSDDLGLNAYGSTDPSESEPGEKAPGGEYQWLRDETVEEERDHIDIFELFRPLVSLMNFFGVPAYDQATHQEWQSRGRDMPGLASKVRRKWWTFLRILLLTHVLRLVAGFLLPKEQSVMYAGDFIPLVGGVQQFNRIVAIGSILFAVGTMGTFKFFGTDAETQKKVSRLWEESTMLPLAACRELERSLLSWQRVGLVVSLVLIVTIPAGHLMLCFNSAKNMQVLSAAFPWLIVNGLCFVSTTAVWTLSCAWFVMVCVAIIKLYDYVLDDLKDQLHGPISVTRQWSRFVDNRDRHFGVTVLVKALDQYLRRYVFYTCMLDTVLMCFSVYEIISTTQTGFVLIMLIVWSAGLTLHLMFVTLAAALVSSSAHTPYKILYGLSEQPLPPIGKQVIALFCQKLAGAEIGLSCLDFFVVTKGATLKLFSMLVTYFFIVQQFSVSEDEDKSNECDCSATTTSPITLMYPTEAS